jgi:thioredoxin-like negative regulator of GroEL
VGAKIIRKFAVLCLAGVLFSMAVGIISVSEPVQAAGKSIDWNTRQILWYPFAKGLREARHSGRPVLVVFYAEWCRHCVNYSRLFHTPQVVDLSNALVMVRVDVDEHPNIAARYSPDGGYVPRTMILRPDGSLIKDIRGPHKQYRYNLEESKPDELLDVMREAADLNSAPR